MTSYQLSLAHQKLHLQIGTIHRTSLQDPAPIKLRILFSDEMKLQRCSLINWTSDRLSAFLWVAVSNQVGSSTLRSELPILSKFAPPKFPILCFQWMHACPEPHQKNTGTMLSKKIIDANRKCRSFLHCDEDCLYGLGKMMLKRTAKQHLVVGSFTVKNLKTFTSSCHLSGGFASWQPDTHKSTRIRRSLVSWQRCCQRTLRERWTRCWLKGFPRYGLEPRPQGVWRGFGGGEGYEEIIRNRRPPTIFTSGVG